MSLKKTWQSRWLKSALRGCKSSGLALEPPLAWAWMWLAVA
jgi:hypothetical protein